MIVDRSVKENKDALTARLLVHSNEVFLSVIGDMDNLHEQRVRDGTEKDKGLENDVGRKV